MEDSPEATRKATRTGAAVLTVILVGLAGALALASVQWHPMRTWSVYGSFGDGFRGLRVGSPVRVGGVTMGEVVEIHMDPQAHVDPQREPAEPMADDEPQEGVGRLLVVFELDGQIQLRTDAKIVHDVNPFSGIGELDILNVGTRKSPALPGRIGRSMTLAPVQPTGRAFPLAMRRSALATILGAEGAREWARIAATLQAIEGMFLESTGLTDPASGETWGPNQPGAATALLESIRSLRTEIEKDLEPWEGQVDSIRARAEQIRARIEEREPSTESLVPRFRRLTSMFGPESGLRGIAKEMQPLFEAVSADLEPIRTRLNDAWRKAQTIGSIARGLWPELRDDLMVTRTGFSIASSELWLAMGPDFWTTAVRVLQPLSKRDQQALGLIYATNQVAMSAEDLRSAIEEARDLGAVQGIDLDPRLRTALERRVMPALQRYRRDLSDLMRTLDAVAADR